MDFLNFLLSNLTTILTIITLIVALVKYVKKTIKEKNWSKVIDLIVKYMKEAEEKFDNGADRKEWVLAMIKVSSETINFDVNYDEVSSLIDDLCSMSKVVNAPEGVSPK